MAQRIISTINLKIDQSKKKKLYSNSDISHRSNYYIYELYELSYIAFYNAVYHYFFSYIQWFLSNVFYSLCKF